MHRYLDALKFALDVRGGGFKGAVALARRAMTIFRTVGLTGFLRWIQGAGFRSRVVGHETRADLSCVPTSIEDIDSRVGVVAHIYYADLIEELAEYLSNIPVPFTLLVSTPDKLTGRIAEESFRKIPNVKGLKIRVVENRGRDIGPLVSTFREDVLQLDIICHIHTKKSFYTGMEQKGWRRYLMRSLLGSKDRVSWILGTLDAIPELGIVYPEAYSTIPLSAHRWLANEEHARDLARAMDIALDTEGYIDFPAGSMFWSKVSAIKPLYDLKLRLNSFPVEEGQTDGTLHHAVERIFAELVKGKGLRIGVMPEDASNSLRAEGEKNWRSYFSVSLRDKVIRNAHGAELASFDVIDTLAVRTFLTPSGALAYLSEIVSKRFALDDFSTIRERAQRNVLAKKGSDPDIDQIYEEITALSGLPRDIIQKVKELELDTERSQMRVRPAVAEVMAELGDRNIRTIGISDMYLGSSAIRAILPPESSHGLKRIFVSCETGQRKDTAGAWKFVEDETSISRSRWLHVGDNEFSDVHQPLSQGLLPPVHVLSPYALLHAVPYLRGLTRTRTTRRWQDELWLGLVANRLTFLADTDPARFGTALTLDTPETLGYTVLGPLLLDYLAWIGRETADLRHDAIAFVSRDGYPLKLGYDTICDFAEPERRRKSIYLLSSRRSAGVAGARLADDVLLLLDSPFEGTLHNLLIARMGDEIAGIVLRNTDSSVHGSIFKLPSMRSEVAEILQTSMASILEVAAKERESYLSYWSRELGQAKPLIADIGYSGSIQAALSRMLGVPLDGAYFALTRRASNVPGSLKARFHDERTDGARSASAVLRHDILLESLLKAPHAQLSKFELEAESGQIRAVHVVEEQTKKQHALLDSVHSGACDFIRDVGNVIGSDILKMDLDRALVQEPLANLGVGAWRTGSWGRMLYADDFYTGRGMVHPIP